jgi:DNA-binding GntR family transcriptional regulator
VTLIDQSSGPIRGDTPEPLWLQAAEAIARDIADGSLPHGVRLPAERELCQRLSISRVTLRKALLKLVDDGLVTSSHGRGWYVGSAIGHPGSTPRNDWPNTLESFSETAARLGLSVSSRVQRAVVLPATLDEAEELGIVPGMPMFHLDRVRSLGGVPIATDSSLVPAELVPGIAGVDFREASLYAVLDSAGVAPARAEATIEARGADVALAGELGVEPGAPILVMHERVHAADERPVLLSEIRYAGDRYRLRTLFIRTPATRSRGAS